MMTRDELRRLHFVNVLFAPLTGQDLYLAKQIQDAIATSVTELTELTAADPESAAKYDEAFNREAARLLEKLIKEQPRHGFFHWDASRTDASGTLLFARAELMVGLKALAIYPEATLLVTNLRPAVLPAGQRETPRRKAAYAELIAFIQDLTAARTRPHANLHLLLL